MLDWPHGDRWLVLAFAGSFTLAACARSERVASGESTRLVLAAYSAPRDLFEQAVVPAFEAEMRSRGRSVHVETSYLASGAQARAVIGGFEADVVALALELDVDEVRDAGLISHDWRSAPHGGMWANTVVAFAVREGNPKHIVDWADLPRPGVEILTPNPKTSGGAMWNVNALYGAALGGHAGVERANPAAAEGFLRKVLPNVLIMDKGARESMITFEKGVGDVAITYESEIVAGHLAGRHYDAVIPSSTIVVEIPAALVDRNADKHGVRDVAEAFVAFLHGDKAKECLPKYGFRPSSGAEARADPTVNLWRIDFLGGWSNARRELYGDQGLFSRTWQTVVTRE